MGDEIGVDAGVERMLVTGTCLDDIKEAIELSKTSPRLWFTVGIHPTRCNEFVGREQDHLNVLKQIINENKDKVVAIGINPLFSIIDSRVMLEIIPLDKAHTEKKERKKERKKKTVFLSRLIFIQASSVWITIAASFFTKNKKTAVIWFGFVSHLVLF